MFNKAMMVAAASAAVVALAVPGAVSASWQHNGGQLQEDASLTDTGQAKFQGQIGSVECQMIQAVQLIAGTTTAQGIFDVDNEGAANDEAECTIGGAFVSVGCTDAEQMTVSGSFVAHGISTTTLEGTTGTIQTHLTGGVFCPKTVQLTPGIVHVTTGQDLFEQAQLSGTITAHAPSGEQKVTISGWGTTTPVGTYGVA